jgi:hypothetical protein
MCREEEEVDCSAVTKTCRVDDGCESSAKLDSSTASKVTSVKCDKAVKWRVTLVEPCTVLQHLRVR